MVLLRISSKYAALYCSQTYKHFMIVNYEPWIVNYFYHDLHKFPNGPLCLKLNIMKSHSLVNLQIIACNVLRLDASGYIMLDTIYVDE